MFHTFFTPDYKLVINPKLKYIHLNINEQGELIVKAPSNSKNQIAQLLHKKHDWIEKAQKKFMQKKGKIPTFEKNIRLLEKLGSGEFTPTIGEAKAITSDKFCKTSIEELYYLGNPYPLTLKHTVSKKSTNLVSFEYIPNDGFILKYNELNKAEFVDQIDRFYTYKAKEIIAPMVHKEAQIMSLFPTAISFRKTKRQWGSCSSKNRLSFNTGLIKLPLDVIQYVIIHELAHIKHKHHQKAFWQEVERYSPHYKKREQQLKEYLT